MGKDSGGGSNHQEIYSPYSLSWISHVRTNEMVTVIMFEYKIIFLAFSAALR